MLTKSKWKFILLNLDVVVASVAMCLLVAITFGGVIARYIINQPFAWIEEVQAALIVWTIFGAAGAAYRTANHAAIDAFYEFFPNVAKKIVDIAGFIVLVLTLAFLSYYSVQYINVFAASGRTTAILHMSYRAIFSIVPISCIWQVFNYIIVVFFKYSEQEPLIETSEEEVE